MPMSAGSRLSSAVVRAALSTLVALASHVAAGGQMPTAPGLVVPLALSTAVCFQLAGKGLSLWRLSTAVLASQWIFHQLFGLGSGSATLTTTGGIHAGHDVGSISVHAAGHAHAGGSMTFAHLVAALITIAAIFKAEQLLVALARCTRWLHALIMSRLVATPTYVTSAAPSATIYGWRLGPPVLCVASSPVSRRGPPALRS